VFDALKPLPADGILGIMAMFRADTAPRKVDLSVGVYQDESGNTPVFECVKKAEQQIFDEQVTKTYVAIAGNAGFNRGVEKLMFGDNAAVIGEGRVATVQTPGGSGALSVAGHVIQRAKPGSRVYLSNPSWPNHAPLLSLAGLKMEQYPYYDQSAHRVDFERMLATFEGLNAGDVVLLHGCCHNPCGADLSHDQWRALAEICGRRGIVPLIDFAYQGLAEGMEPDAFGVREMLNHVPELVVVNSFSKNLGLYRERVGACCIVSPSPEQSGIVASNLASIARSIYSMPPDHGAAIVDRIIHDPALRALWSTELDAMRTRINALRQLLVDKLAERKTSVDFSFMAKERGMFSFLGISKEQVVRLREEFHVYMVESSRINVAGINSANADYVADSIAAVV